MKKYVYSLMTLAVIILAGCSAPKDIAYMQDADQLPAEVLNATAKAAVLTALLCFFKEF